jgi:prepilin-type N-terminal cleavage/methylation domain-containing protein
MRHTNKAQPGAAGLAAPLLNSTVSMTLARRDDRGFSLTELMLTVAVLGTVAAMSVPILTDLTADIKVNEAARMVERELQDARLRAVSANRALRARLNCPAAGYLRTVEVLNSVADAAANRCLLSAYPFPAADNNIVTRPNFDGPMRTLPEPATVSSYVIEFRPDGTAYNVVADVASTMATEVTITVTRYSKSRTLTVNGTGKVKLN